MFNTLKYIFYVLAIHAKCIFKKRANETNKCTSNERENPMKESNKREHEIHKDIEWRKNSAQHKRRRVTFDEFVGLSLFSVLRSVCVRHFGTQLQLFTVDITECERTTDTLNFHWIGNKCKAIVFVRVNFLQTATLPIFISSNILNS